MNKRNLRSFSITFILFFLAGSVTRAQVSGYTFAQSSGSYTPITGGLVVVPADDIVTSDDDIYTDNAIGFTFNYNHIDYTSFGISANGYIWFGSGSPAVDTYTPISAPGNLAGSGLISGTVAPLGRDLLKRIDNPFGELRVETTGSAPNRVCVIQFQNWRGYGIGLDVVYNFQVRLYETTNVIEFVYGTFSTVGAIESFDFEVGLRGSDNTDFINVEANATDWAGTTVSLTNGATSTISETVYPANGTTFTWTPGAPLPDCSGTPDPGTISGPGSVCSGYDFQLINTGATQAGGMYYTWQSAPTPTGPWTVIPGQTDFQQAIVSQTDVTYYRFADSCSISDLTATSNVIPVTIKPTNQCYCQPTLFTLHTLVDDYVSNVTIVGTTLNSSNATDGSTGYSQVPSTPASNTADLSQITDYTIEATVANDPGQVSVWIDFDQNGTFDASEFFPLTISGTIASGTISVPFSALTGQTGMRIRARFSEFFAEDACATFGSGETEDYLVNIVQNAALNGAIVDVIPPETSCDPGNNVTVKLRNSGSIDIPAGAATVALYITGANPQGPFTQTNSTLLAPGDTATLVFTGSFLTPGDNVDSVFIQSLAGDTYHTDDTLLTGHLTLPAAVAAPYVEDFEADVPGWTVSQIAGSGNWGLSPTVEYPDLDPAFSLDPKHGAAVALFDNYDFAAGTISRLMSNCIGILANANSGCGYVAGFYYTQDAQYPTLPDSLIVSVTTDGGSTFTRLGLVQRVDSTLAPTDDQAPYSIPEWRLYTFDVASFAGQTVQFAFDAYSEFGNMIAIDSFFVGPKTVSGNVALASGAETGAALTPALTQCGDAGGWTYYADGNSSRYLFGVQWDPSATGINAAAKAQATAKINIDRKWYAAEDVDNQRATYTMQRYWDVNLNGAALAAPVNVRFFYTQRELDSIVVAKNNFLAANPGAPDEGFMWFKTNSGAFIPSPASVTPDGVVNAIPLNNVNIGGATINGILYAQFDGVTSFSGGTAASGVGPSTPVPVSLLSFNAQRTGRVNKITWSTSQEMNTRHFVVERSTNARDYYPLGKVTASMNSSNVQTYSFIDNTPARGINYYRLRVVDIDNSSKFSAIKNVRNEGTADVALYPNPVNSVLLINITSDRMDKAQVSITDMNGRLVHTNAMSLNEGANYMNFNAAKLSTGTYMIRIQLNNDLVIRKFNKL